MALLDNGQDLDDCAAEIGYDRNAVGRWERGENLPSFQALIFWCDALGVELSTSPRLGDR